MTESMLLSYAQFIAKCQLRIKALHIPVTEAMKLAIELESVSLNMTAGQIHKAILKGNVSLFGIRLIPK